MATTPRSLVFLIMTVLLAGCVSTQKRYDKAEELMAQGRYAEAAEYYVKVLKKEPDWPEAREGLQESGARAVEAFLEEAGVLRDRGRYADALDVLDRLDALRTAAAGVEVTVAVPDDYAAFRAALAEDALAAALRAAEAAEQQGDYAAALRAYERAAAYTGDPARHADLRRRQARVQLLWADREAEAGRYRAAYDHAGRVLTLVPADDPLAERAAAMQDGALAAGTYAVAFLPFWQTDAVARAAPRALVADLNDVLLYEYWTDLGLFVAPADPVAVRRELRRLRYDRTVVTHRQAAQIGRVVEADYVVVGEWTELDRTERSLKEKTRKARLRGRAATAGGRRDTTYVEQRLTLGLDGTVAYRLIDPFSRRVIDEGTVSAKASGSLTRARYAGDYRDLDLSGAERSLFEEAELDVLDALTRTLVDDLAERLAERVYDDLMRHIP